MVVPVGVVCPERGVAFDESAGEKAVLSTQKGRFLPRISPPQSIVKPLRS